MAPVFDTNVVADGFSEENGVSPMMSAPFFRVFIAFAVHLAPPPPPPPPGRRGMLPFSTQCLSQLGREVTLYFQSGGCLMDDLSLSYPLRRVWEPKLGPAPLQSLPIPFSGAGVEQGAAL